MPINRFDVRSFITNVRDGATVPAGKPLALRGIAFDGGYGIRDVAVSADGGKTWTSAALGRDLGKYSFREWQMTVDAAGGQARDQGSRGQSRSASRNRIEPLWNPAGYMRNVVETTRVRAA